MNEAPRSKLRGITELKHSELLEIFPSLPLPLHIPFDGLPVGPLPYRGHIVPVGPKLPPHRTRFTAGFRRKISRAVMRLNICTIQPGATFGCALQSNGCDSCPSQSLPSRSETVPQSRAAVSWIIVVTASSSSAFRSFTGKTMW
jgi:hypothetical protein